MKDSLVAFLFVTAAPATALATEYHVGTTGDDANPGTSAQPFRTIQHAAGLLQPGDTCTVHAGTYREWVNPAHGGTSESTRIVYRAADGDQVSIKGSEEVKSWTADGTVYRTVVPNTTFGSFNPYSENVRGSWLSYGGAYHLGEVYRDGTPFSEVQTENAVRSTKNSWFATVDATNTTILANFAGADPSGSLVEINVRKYVISPTTAGLGYITFQGFTIQHGSPNWAPPDASPQEGMIMTNWGLRWVFENNHITDGKTVCLCSGWPTDRTTNSIDGLGNHLVRHNTIERCGEAGIAGMRGWSASVIEGNLIQDINPTRHFGGYETAAIKIHTAEDVVIKNNILRRVRAPSPTDTVHCGIWLDWEAQGSRVSSNLLYDLDQYAFDIEMGHGPNLFDNNIVVGSRSTAAVTDDSENEIFVHNLFVQSYFAFAKTDDRSSGYYVPHTLQRAGSSTHSWLDNRYLNNTHIARGTESILQGPGYRSDYNVFYGAGRPTSWGDAHSVNDKLDPAFAITTRDDGAEVSITTDSTPHDIGCPLITRDYIGVASLTKMGIENHDGTPITIDHDIRGTVRDKVHPTAGPFEGLTSGKHRFVFTAGVPTSQSKWGDEIPVGGSGGSGGSDAGVAGSGATASGGKSGAGGAAGTSTQVENNVTASGGCGCRTTPRRDDGGTAMVLLALLALERRRRSRI